uniref:Mon2/Sec7/BIG1-like HDS domain-containing protein n=3 Tax=Schistocephalus solidus TaxID=70667 RepID=A0A0X3PYV0_SCHSO
MKVVSSLVSAQSLREIDKILISFSSNYCAGKRSSASDRIFGSTDMDSLLDAPINDPAGTLLNADAVYAASIAALALNYRLLEAGFYSRSSGRLAGRIMREEQFLNSLLNAGLLLYVSEAWVSQVYRGICKQDILGIGGLVLGRSEDVSSNQRGACLIKFLADYDGITWRPERPTAESECTSDVALTSAGCLLVSSILDFGWDSLVETLTNAVAAAGMKVSDRDSLLSLGPQFAKLFAGSSAQPTSAEDPVRKRSFAASFSLFVSLLSGDFSASVKHSRAAELGAALLNSLFSLQELARLACRLGGTSIGADSLQSRCGRVFALLMETTRVATTADCARSSHRLHSASALSLDAILSSALELGCQCADCWVHLFRACELVDELEYAYFSTDGISNSTHPTECRYSPTVSLPDMVTDFCRQNSGDTGITAGVGGLLTEEQTGYVLGHLSQSVDRIFQQSTDRLPMPILLAFLDRLLHVSIKNISSRYLLPANSGDLLRRPKSFPVFGRHPSGLSNSLTQGAAALAARIRGHNTESTRLGAGNTKTSPLLIDRLAQLLLYAIRSTDRSLLALLLLWMPASQHFVDACCFSTAATAPALQSDASEGGGGVDQAQQLFVSHRALSALHECIIALVSARPELPYFSANETFCKPFELLLRLEMCDGELQDRIICCISEVVEAGSSCLHSGWRPIFAALRSIKVAFLVEGQRHMLDGVSAVGCRSGSRPLSLGPVEGTADEKSEVLNLTTMDFMIEGTVAAATDATTSRQRISTVLEIFEIFLTAKDLVVFCEIAVDCVRCLLRYLSAGELQSTNNWDREDCFVSESQGVVEADAGSAADETTVTTSAAPVRQGTEDMLVSSSADTRRSSASAAEDSSRVEASCSLCFSTLPLLTRCCQVLQVVWSSGLNHVIRFARRHAHLASGGAPQFNFLPTIRSCASRPLQERLKLITPWFPTQRLLEPTLSCTEQPSELPKLWSLRSLDELDKPSGVLHLWLLLLDGVITASWQCNPRVQRSVFEEFTHMLDLAVRGLSDESCQARLTCVSTSVDEVVSSAAQVNGDGEEQSLSVLIGPTFAVFVVNHVLLPKLQIAVDEFAASTMQGQVCLPSDERQIIVSISHDRLLLSKLCLLIGQTTQLIGTLFSRFQSSGNIERVVGFDLMLHQTLRILVECASLRSEKLSRLSVSCFRHLMLSISARLTSSQWDLAANHFEEVFRVCLFPLHTLTTVHETTARRSPTSVPVGDTSGLQVSNLRPVSTTSETEERDRLRQLTLHLFQLDEQRQACVEDVPADVASQVPSSGDADDSTVPLQLRSQVLTFDLSVYPLSTCSLERPPVETISFEELVCSLLNLRLLMQLIGELSLVDVSVIPESIHRLVAVYPDAVLNSSDDPDDGFEVPIAECHSRSGLMKCASLETRIRLMNCLCASYSACFDFDQCSDLKIIFQRLLNLPSAANLYQQTNLSYALLQLILLQFIETGVSGEACAHLMSAVRAAYTAFDANFDKLTSSHFRCLPFVAGARTAASPLVWLRQFSCVLPVVDSEQALCSLLAGLATYTAQFYLYLLRSDPGNGGSMSKSPFRRIHSVSVTGSLGLLSNGKPSAINSSDGSFKTPASESESADKPNRRFSQKLDSIRDLFHVKSSHSTGARKVGSPPCLHTADASTSTLCPDDQGMQDTEARRYCAAQLLVAMSDSFLAYANPANGPTAVASLHAVFTENVARLIAVADHVSLRRALANWFMRLVNPQVDSPTVSVASATS